MYRRCFWSVIVVGCLCNVIRVGAAQDESIKRDVDDNEASRALSNKHQQQVLQLIRDRSLATRECTKVLATRAAKMVKVRSEEDYHAAIAAGLLGELRSHQSSAIDALCANLTLNTVVVVSGDDGPLLQFRAAKALVAIGGREAAEGVIRHMKLKLDRRELLICAHILNQIDYHAITFERLRIAKEQARLEEPQEVREVFFHNLAQVQQWIEDPAFEHDEKFRP
jgi:hypothetical protein